MVADDETEDVLEHAIDEYLAGCYLGRTAARASELAEFLGISRSRLVRMATRILGVSIKAALRTRQLARAAGLLLESSETVDEVGVLSGFGDRRTFHRSFRRAFGCSPAEFRRRDAKRL
jgi:xylan 1,4-beta-xylosidase